MKTIHELHISIEGNYLYSDQSKKFIVRAIYDTDNGPIVANYSKVFDSDDFEALFSRLMKAAEQEITEHILNKAQDTPSL